MLRKAWQDKIMSGRADLPGRAADCKKAEATTQLPEYGATLSKNTIQHSGTLGCSCAPWSVRETTSKRSVSRGREAARKKTASDEKRRMLEAISEREVKAALEASSQIECLRTETAYQKAVRWATVRIIHRYAADRVL
ncbi:hypothetical protein NBRC116589_17700 [Ruegeria sp. HU-ET01832]